MTDSNPDARGRRSFPTTHWSQVIEAADPHAPRTREALAALCGDYWYPLYSYIRRRGRDADTALDLVQGYFAELLERGVLAAADPARGRFRTFLLTDCGFYLSKQQRRERALKRGGGRIVPIEVDEAEGRYQLEPAHELTAERQFDRAWALTLLERVIARLREEYRASGREVLFEQLKWVLERRDGGPRYADIARGAGTTEGAIQAAAHRLRRRYRETLREHIAATVSDPAEVDDEVCSLFAALED